MKKLLNSLLFITTIAFSAYSQGNGKTQAVSTAYAATITAEDLSRHLHIIAADSMEGRNTGERGQKMAADYIANQFFNYGLQPVITSKDGEKTFYQEFDLAKKSWGEVYVETGTQRREFLKDFYVLGTSAIPQEEAKEVVFAGYGIDAPNYSDYKNINVKDKIALVLAGEPKDKKGNSLVSGTSTESEWAASWQKKVTTAKEKGASMVFVVAQDEEAHKQMIAQYREYLMQPTLGFKTTKAVNNATFFISPDMATEIFGINDRRFKRLEKRITRRKKSTAGAIDNGHISLKAERKEELVNTENVLGFVEGTDKKDEVIVITAHYDHVGVEDGQIYNGADDDGSGTVAVLELAQAFAEAKRDGNGPRRSILFMTVTGEEKGLLGSEYYTYNPVFPLKNTVANLNIDMIGRMDQAHNDNPDYIYLIGSDKLSSELHKISEEANQKHTQLQLDYTYNDPNDPNRFYYRSDHYNFAKNRIPVIFYFNGVHADYHKPTDTVEKIHFGKIEKISRLVFHTAWEVANRDQRITVDSNKQ